MSELITPVTRAENTKPSEAAMLNIVRTVIEQKLCPGSGLTKDKNAALCPHHTDYTTSSTEYGTGELRTIIINL